MDTAHASPIGRLGRLTVATRGADGPGEVVVPIRGGSETFTAYSAVPLHKDQQVYVAEDLGGRKVTVVAWGERQDPLLTL